MAVADTPSELKLIVEYRLHRETMAQRDSLRARVLELEAERDEAIVCVAELEKQATSLCATCSKYDTCRFRTKQSLTFCVEFEHLKEDLQ